MGVPIRITGTTRQAAAARKKDTFWAAMTMQIVDVSIQMKATGKPRTGRRQRMAGPWPYAIADAVRDRPDWVLPVRLSMMWVTGMVSSRCKHSGKGEMLIYKHFSQMTGSKFDKFSAIAVSEITWVSTQSINITPQTKRLKRPLTSMQTKVGKKIAHQARGRIPMSSPSEEG